MYNLIIMLLCALCVHPSYEYKAKILDYFPGVGLTPIETMNKNVIFYRAVINQDVDIVVFPEYGLTSADTDVNYKEYAIVVPEPLLSDTMCDKNSEGSGNQEILTKLACIAKEKSTYLVVNLLEKHENKSIFYNTNVVFDRKGQLIAKYRKINLFDTENKYLTAGTDIVTFTTDFGVTFGTFICADIRYDHPGQTILKTNATDIIYTTDWCSQLPLLSALSVQDGYAKMAGVNLLASGYNDPKEGTGGSGIYYANGKNNIVVQSHDGTFIIQDDVTKISNRNPERTCENLLDPVSMEQRNMLPGIENIKLNNNIKEHPEFYTFFRLDSSESVHEKRLCSKNDILCCNFYARISQPISEGPTYNFIVSHTERDDYGCALIACKSSDFSSCGVLLQFTKHAHFDTITINATLEGIGSHSIPVTTDQNLRPFQYSFCRKGKDISIKVKNQREISAVGIFIGY